MEINSSSHDSSTSNIVAGNQIVHNYPQPPVPSDAGTQPVSSGGSSSSGANGGLVMVAILIGVAVLVLKGIGAFDKMIPASAQKTPPAARSAAVAVVRKAIVDCALETAPSPATCPQSENQVANTASVRWSLYGDPTDGEVDRFSDRTVYIMGTAIMAVQADSSATVDESALFDVKKVGYYAEASWDGKHAQLKTIVGSKAPAPEPIIKRSRPYSSETALAQVAKFLKECAAVHSVNPSPACPAHFVPDGGPAVRDPNWRIDGDPIRDARVSFNRDWGLVEVVGQLRMTLYDGTKERAVYSAPYRAQVYPASENHLDVLQITMQE